MRTATGIYTLYRFYTADDTLLYVGLTINPGRRMEKHRDSQPWWPDVARITMEQHPDMDALRAAEKKAIQTEKPLHNIRMNGRASVEAEASQPAMIEGLVGRWFHSWRDVTDDDSDYAKRRGRVLLWQGEILERVGTDLYLVETYSWLDGTPYEQQLVAAHDMVGWTFYASNIEMIAALGCREITDGYECSGPVAYITVNRGIGSTAVCYHCAGYYGQVQPIIWRDGKATLGKTTKVPHPLSPEGLAR